MGSALKTSGLRRSAMQLILVVEAFNRDPVKNIVSQFTQPDDAADRQWQYLLKKFPAVHVEALRFSDSKLVIKIIAP